MLSVLLKYPTRSRPELFRQNIDRWEYLASGETPLQWLVTADSDDESMNQPPMKTWCRKRNIAIHYGSNANKIAACNADMDKAEPWDVVVLVSDDMRPLQQNWDKRIVAEMPTLDMALWFNDGRQKRICTLSIMGKPVYDSFGFIYDPDFKGFYCDELYTQQMQERGKLKYIGEPVFAHEWGIENKDALLKHNHKYYAEDRDTFRRKAREFRRKYSGRV